MVNNLPDFPLLFDRIGAFLTDFNALREKRLKSSPDAFVVEFDKLIRSNSLSEAGEALAAFEIIVETIYKASVRACPGGSTRMR